VSGYHTWTRTEDFDWDTYGQKVAVGLEYLPTNDLIFGIETSYYRDSVQGTFFDEKGPFDTVDFWRGMLYVTRNF
jgi:hypothetical protein